MHVCKLLGNMFTYMMAYFTLDQCGEARSECAKTLLRKPVLMTILGRVCMIENAGVHNYEFVDAVDALNKSIPDSRVRK